MDERGEPILTELTIDELAAQVGMTVRNIRAHQSRGLLARPRIVGRTGYYGPAHRTRLEEIRRLQDEGLNLAAIARVVDGELAAAAVGPFEGAAAEHRSAAELAGALGVAPDDAVIDRAEALGLVQREAERVRVDLPALVALAEELATAGVPLDAMLDTVADVQGAADAVARSFLTLVDQHLATPILVDTGGDLEQFTAVVERMHGQARLTLEVLFDQAMARAIRAYLDPDTGGPEALERLA